MSFKKLWVYIKKFFHFIWYGEGLLSWVTCFIFAFIVIRYLFYPSLGLLLGTSFPIVAVMSESMQHPSNFEDWWSKTSCCDPGCTQRVVQGKIYENIKINKNDFEEFPFKKGFNPGDIIVLYSPEIIKIGDVIVFMSNHRQEPIIHRVVEVMEDGKFYKTKGDNNCGSGDFELRIAKSDVMGKAKFSIPYLGWLKLALVKLIGVF